MIKRRQYLKLSLDYEDKTHSKSTFLHPPTSIIINPAQAHNFIQNSRLFQGIQDFDFEHPLSLENIQLFVIDQIPYFIYTGSDHVILRSLLTVSRHLICYHINPGLQTVIQSKWWQFKSLSHMYHIHSIPTLYFYNPRIKANKQLQGAKLNYLLNQQILNALSNIQKEEINYKQSLNLAQTCQLLKMFIYDRDSFKEKDYFTDKLNYIELFRLESNRCLNEQIGSMIYSSADRYEINGKIEGLEAEGKRDFERKMRKLEVFNGIVDKHNEKEIFFENRLKSSNSTIQQKEKPKLIRRSRWHTNKTEYIQRLIIIILVIILIQLVFGHNLFSLTVSLIMAILFLKFVD